ncbi:MAG TPA: ABC transporter permease [Candidatus Limnocylindrales bacterium]|jgi:simple sugar transport system permease protein|nr:ABC transporter permease [Candidatus Limnocylindrales bacterium]
MTRLRVLLGKALVPVLSVVTALIFGAIVIVLTDLENLSRLGTDPIGAIGGAVGGVFRGYGAMLSGAFGDPGRILTAIQSGNVRTVSTAIRPITETLVASTPLIFTGLAVAISFRAGMFNIGVDGQLMIGALGATITAIALAGQVPAFVILIAALAVGTLSGGLWGFIPGFLKARTGAHEVITTIMLNYVAAQVVFFALRSTWLRASGSTSPVSKNLQPIVDVPTLLPFLPSIRLDLGFVVALLVGVAVSWLLFRTTLGFELRAAGFNLTAARYAGMSAGGSMVLAMALSGALGGLGGSFMVLGTVSQLTLDLSGGIGFTAIALALLASLRPSGVILAALLFGALTTGGKLMGIQSGIPFDLLSFIMALVIMFVAAPGLIRSIWRVRVSKPAPEVAATTQPTGTV